MKLFEITLNWYGEIHRLYSHAQRASSARANAIQQLSEKLGRTASSVRRYFYEGNRITIIHIK
jgi:hypothetical protein